MRVMGATVPTTKGSAMPKHVNSENEVISINQLGPGPFEGQYLLVVHDDPPPQGSGQQAPMLLDEGTRKWLLKQLNTLEL